MKKLHTAVLLAVLAFAPPAGADTDARVVCRDECTSCTMRCGSAKDKESCRRTCHELKRMCCISAGRKPGAYGGCACGS